MKKQLPGALLSLCIALLLLPAVALPANAAAEPWDGSVDTTWYDRFETETNFTISTPEELAGLAKLVNGGTDFAGKTIALDRDLDLGDREWTPIGSYTNRATNSPFAGTFDGGGHEITGLYINASGEDSQGLFGCVNGTVKNLGVSGTVTGVWGVGGVVGHNYRGTVESCHNTGTVTGRERVGGVVGDNYIGTVESCYNTGAVSGGERVGGVAGGSSGMVESCFNTGVVTGGKDAGGVVGNNTGNAVDNMLFTGAVWNCYNTGAVTGTDSWVGGVVGTNAAAMESCYNTGAVTGKDGVGGVAGYNSSRTFNDMLTSGTVRNCYNTGVVTGRSYVGGVAGNNERINTMRNCFFLRDGCVNRRLEAVSENKGTAINVKAKNAAEFAAADTGFDWVFGDVWDMGTLNGEPDGEKIRPVLQAIPETITEAFDRRCEHNSEDECGGNCLCADDCGCRPKHEHGWSNGWSSDETAHWHACTAVNCPYETAGGYSGITDETDKEKAAYAGHDPGYKWDVNVHWAYCDTCGWKGNETVHVWDEWTVDQEATADAQGSKHRDCTVCGYTETAAIPKPDQEPDTPPETVTTYTISMLSTANGTVTADKDKAAADETVTLTVTPDSGYRLVAGSLTVTKTGRGSTWNVPVNGEGTSSDPYTFRMPAGDVEVTAQFAKPAPGGTGGSSSGNIGGSSSGGADGWGDDRSQSTLYTVTVTGTARGKVRSNFDRTAAGTGVTLTVAPDAGYELVSLRAADRSGKEVTLKDGGDGTWIFSMPGSDVTVTAAFASRAAASSGGGGKRVCPRDNTCPLTRFVDLNVSLWYHDGIHCCIENGLMGGVSRLYFAPDIATNRAMFVTILYRLEGEPAVGGGSFTDVPAGMWYAAPIAWAAANGIMEGYGNGRFQPEDPITREQMAATLYRYARYKGYDVSARGSLSGYTDGRAVSDWASDSMRWAVGEGLVTGISSRILFLDPVGDATRAQMATILMRFRTNVMK